MIESLVNLSPCIEHEVSFEGKMVSCASLYNMILASKVHKYQAQDPIVNAEQAQASDTSI